MSGASSNTSSSRSVGGAAETVEQMGDLSLGLAALEVDIPLRHHGSAEEGTGGSERRGGGRAGSVGAGSRGGGGEDSGGGSRAVSDESEVDVLGVRQWLIVDVVHADFFFRGFHGS